MTPQQDGEALLLLDSGELPDPMRLPLTTWGRGKGKLLPPSRDESPPMSSDTTLAAREWGAFLQPGLCCLGKGGAMGSPWYLDGVG